MMIRAPIAVTLDLFNTLVFIDENFDNKKATYKAAERLKEFGVSITNPLEVSMLYRERVREFMAKRKTSLVEFTNDQVLQEVLTRLGVTCDPIFVKQTIKTYFEESLDNIHLFDGTMNVLRTLKDNGIKLGLISNHSWPENGWDVIKKTNIIHFFDTIIFSGDIGVVKPSPKIFKEASNRLSVPSNDIVHVGDDFSADVIGAGKAGMRAIWKTSDGLQIPVSDYPFIIDKISDIRQILDILTI